MAYLFCFIRLIWTFCNGIFRAGFSLHGDTKKSKNCLSVPLPMWLSYVTLLFWRNCHHGLHRKLSTFGALLMIFFSRGQHFRLRDNRSVCVRNKNVSLVSSTHSPKYIIHICMYILCTTLPLISPNLYFQICHQFIITSKLWDIRYSGTEQECGGEKLTDTWNNGHAVNCTPISFNNYQSINSPDADGHGMYQHVIDAIALCYI